MPLNLKNIWKRSSSKHEKLYDEWDLAPSQDLDNMCSTLKNGSLKAKYLGHIPVEHSMDYQGTSEKAVEAIMSMRKGRRKMIKKVILSVNVEGIEVLDASSENILFNLSIFSVCNCMAYTKSKRIFAFLATNSRERTECHAFLCSKKNEAKSMALTMGQLFHSVHQMLQTSQLESVPSFQPGEHRFPLLKDPLPGNSKQVKMTYESSSNVSFRNALDNKWISFDENMEEESQFLDTREVANDGLSLKVPSPSYSDCFSAGNQRLIDCQYSSLNNILEIF